MLYDVYQKRLEKCGRLMKEAGLDVLLLTKPSNMFYFTGDGRNRRSKDFS
jgi:Xaa-Pro aminopeptidase